MSEVGSYERKPIAIIYEEKSAYKDTYAGAEDTVFLEAHHLIPSKPITDSVIVLCTRRVQVVLICRCLLL